MTTPPTSAEQAAALDYDAEQAAALDHDAEPQEEWLEQPEDLPRRPRRRVLAPIPAVLLVVLLVAAGFLAGVEVQKGQGSSASSGGLPAGLAALRGSGAGTGASSGARTNSGGGAGLFGGGGGAFPGGRGLAGGLTAGEVSYVSGSTLYVTSAEGNTVKVSAPKGTKVSKTVSTNVHSIHPGDTVIVRGIQSGRGGVTASSITVSSAGSATGTGSSSGSSGGGGPQQLFGSG
ncbi:MAG TPA: hypothetical protein VID29_04535 [Solirubrobacteraceae bacterium]|jgi:hypothetical protein